MESGCEGENKDMTHEAFTIAIYAMHSEQEEEQEQEQEN